MPKISWMNGMDAILNRLLEWMPVLAVIGTAIITFGKWIFNLQRKVESAQADVEDLQNRLELMEARQEKFENKIDQTLLEVNRRIDDCKNSILENLKVVLKAVSHT